jgi:hypothetical protein
MSTPVSGRSLRISGAKVEIPDDLEWPSYDVKVKVTGDIVQRIDNDNQDGKVERVFVLRATYVEVVNE